MIHKYKNHEIFPKKYMLVEAFFDIFDKWIDSFDELEACNRVAIVKLVEFGLKY